MTREEWLQVAAQALTDRALCARVNTGTRFSVGNPARPGRRMARLWDVATDTDGHRQVFISPLLDDKASVLAVLAFAITRARYESTGERISSSRWDALHRTMGFVSAGLDYAVLPTPYMANRLAELAETLPDYPHDATTLRATRTQTTRMIKLSCSCGYVVRTTRTHIERGLPSCPSGHTLALSV
jgi:hypothetical protein